MTEVTPPLENTRFSPFFDFTVLRPPGNPAGDPFCNPGVRRRQRGFSMPLFHFKVDEHGEQGAEGDDRAEDDELGEVADEDGL